jgi:hypothetical protein
MLDVKFLSKNNMLIFSGSDFIVPLSMEGVPRKAARALVKAGKQGVHFEVEPFNVRPCPHKK